MAQREFGQLEMYNAPLFLKPAYKDYLWGGNRLKTEFRNNTNLSPVAEAWELSCHPDGYSMIQNGPWAGHPLAEYIEQYPDSVYEGNTAPFPILIKLIDAEQALSIQVHPDDKYAAAYSDMGKSEMWYVLEAAPNAGIYYGFKQAVSKNIVEDAITDQTLTELLNWVPVKKGDAIFIPAGTVHAIGAGLLIAEVQQSSNLTYRLYDYGRVDQNGQPRELHLDKALDVSLRTPSVHAIIRDETDYEVNGSVLRHVVTCEKFIVTEIAVADCWEGNVTSESFQSLLCIAGEGKLICSSVDYPIKKGQCVFMPAGLGNYIIEGQLRLIRASLPSQHT